MPKKNSITSHDPSQMSFPVSEEEYVPLLAAEKFGFNLPYLAGNDRKLYFRLLSWLTGCVGVDAAGETVRNLRKKGVISNNASNAGFQNLHLISEKDSAGRDQDFEYVTDELLYRITEDLRASKDRPVVKLIKDYLAKAGAEINKQHREHQLAIVPPKNRKEEKFVARQVVYEHKDQSQALVVLQARREVVDTFKKMMAAVAKVCDDPRYGEIGNAEYVALFGYTAKDLRRLLNTNNVRDMLTEPELKGLQFLETLMEAKLLQAERMTNDQIVSSLHRIALNIRQALDEVSVRFDNLESLPHLSAKN